MDLHTRPLKGFSERFYSEEVKPFPQAVVPSSTPSNPSQGRPLSIQGLSKSSVWNRFRSREGTPKHPRSRSS